VLDLALLFIAQFSAVFLMGVQQQNVQGNHKVWAAITSLAIGVAMFYIVAVLAEVGRNGLLTAEGITYLTAGPIAIVSAMYVHPRLRKIINGGTNVKET